MKTAFTTLFAIGAVFAFPYEAWTQDTAIVAPEETTLTPKTDWDVCNETSYIVRMASAVMREGSMTPKGWNRLRPGQCLPVAAPKNSARFIYAESTDVHQGGIREWAGNVPLCVAQDDFTADAAKSCKLQNLNTRNYLAVDPSEARTTLIEPDNFGLNAETAGLQRLLRDNGFKITRIDGLPGRRTSRTLKRFKKDAELPANISNADLIEALAKTAEEKQDEIGLEVCNNTSSRVWTALATRDDGAWLSRGWWNIEQGECLRTYTKNLQGTDAHYYALQENIIEDEDGRRQGDDKRLRSVATTPAQFCVAESKFSALGREYCSESGYAVANFRPLPTDKEGVKVTLSDQDFAAPSPVGLRQ